MNSCILATNFSRSLFSVGELGDACFNNSPTHDKFKLLWVELNKLNTVERTNIHSSISTNQDVRIYFNDKTAGLPAFPQPELKVRLKELTSHLYKRTKDLEGVISACANESLVIHFNAFRQLNYAICCICGTSELAQERVVEDSEQWRADYDHLLSSSLYPYYAVHPANFVPICTTCNQKAKSTKHLIFKETGENPTTRRLSFYPYDESCDTEMIVQLKEDESKSLVLEVTWDITDATLLEKVNTWDDVFQVKSRVERGQGHFETWLNSDCRPKNLNHFKEQINERAQPLDPISLKKEAWEFWRHRLYIW